MMTCTHCHEPRAELHEDWTQLEENVDVEACACIQAACGHWLSAEMEDVPPCEECDRCQDCCQCPDNDLRVLSK
jgi:hypothetical protein